MHAIIEPAMHTNRTVDRRQWLNGLEKQRPGIPASKVPTLPPQPPLVELFGETQHKIQYCGAALVLAAAPAAAFVL